MDSDIFCETANYFNMDNKEWMKDVFIFMIGMISYISISDLWEMEWMKSIWLFLASLNCVQTCNDMTHMFFIYVLQVFLLFLLRFIDMWIYDMRINLWIVWNAKIYYICVGNLDNIILTFQQTKKT